MMLREHSLTAVKGCLFMELKNPKPCKPSDGKDQRSKDDEIELFSAQNIVGLWWNLIMNFKSSIGLNTGPIHKSNGLNDMSPGLFNNVFDNESPIQESLVAAMVASTHT
ncbi:hypothetical protein HanRHA438_Chr17g0838491 [Helianthus annuus]|nr:hypothetical protein HanRHA438_Chr17g0838491 [Helianthus annuus]